MTDWATENFSPCVLIPVYNHWQVLRSTVEKVRGFGLPIVLVNDGSHRQCREVIETIVSDFESVHLVSRDYNGGKGAAVKDGLRAAHALDFTHALQIDADGQHDIDDAQRFLRTAQAFPEALVAGYPVFDESVPKHRYYARYITHVWVCINTLSTTIRDSMCGYRVYPLASSCALIEASRIGGRMDFDGEFIVRWYWAGLPLQQLQTRVVYPEGGVSHFRLWRDNSLISMMHARLFFAMLMLLPRLLARKFPTIRGSARPCR
ncbi:glycosyltransferase family 2 protein [Haliea sp. E1-2-M8]|uniref:glycosyltransferase family 2 protein n=1 Tax=Haliea sp. E1-2-M8 TaxID=3064706 RepID=UPI00271FBC71|nr:glycosyltransferase family 2 protein [Haliea sp. E1-2-M8]MDO8861121.1 glycosyltransferase family 2 protein [Haliea sp. E1-2-M8]